MTGTTGTTGTALVRAGRLTAALGASALACVGIITADVPSSLVVAANVSHLASASAVLPAGTASGTTARTVRAETGATSPTHVPARLA
jgi:hypothetical protein